MPVTPYLIFNGRCEEALGFYEKAIGAEVDALMRFKDSPEPPPPGCAPVDADKIMHSSFKVGGTTIMATDGMTPNGGPKFEGFTLTIHAKDETEADRLFAALSQGGQVQMPLGKTFFAKRFGMVADKFGVSWMLIVE